MGGSPVGRIALQRNARLLRDPAALSRARSPFAYPIDMSQGSLRGSWHPGLLATPVITLKRFNERKLEWHMPVDAHPEPIFKYYLATIVSR